MVKETWDKHFYTNDNSQDLTEAMPEVIVNESLEPDEIIDYIIQKWYQFDL